jgi:hypothetical protein
MMALTESPTGRSLGAPTALVQGASEISKAIAERSARLGQQVSIDPLALMAERAVAAGSHSRGRISFGGSSRLIRSADRWIALTMARTTDWDLAAALLELDRPVDEGDWRALEAQAETRGSDDLRDRATLLGLPLALLSERRRGGGDSNPPTSIHGINRTRIRAASPMTSISELVVGDLSALWAGPLVGRLLAQAGARVIKVESLERPDGARYGDPRFYATMNGAKDSVALDFRSAEGVETLSRLVEAVDVIITASRPRALEQLGLVPTEVLRHSRPRAWLNISGYGSDYRDANRVAFGDDAAVAGGLVAWDHAAPGGPEPSFCGDAIADPLSGLAGTAALLEALESDSAWLLDASMADVAAGMAGPQFSVEGLRATPPDPAGAQSPTSAPELGADTDTVLRELGIG